jgi:hypothetical protein
VSSAQPGTPQPEPHSEPAATTAARPSPPPNSWYLTRFCLLRFLGFVYAVAFLIAALQIVPLIGERGLTPAGPFMALLVDHFGSKNAAFVNFPSLFWFGLSDRLLVGLAWAGFALSLVVVAGYANAIVMALLWALYMSYVHIGQVWYSYGWEIQTLETGFLAIFLCPLLDPRPFSRRPPPILILWLYRWLGFRIMLGAGLIKLRGDSCWRDLTCLYYHYETQPLPNPLSRCLEFAPHWFSKFEVLWNFFIELVAPWFSFGPRTCRHIAGVLLIGFQFILIVSGNLAFLNWLTIVPYIACFDDSFLRRILPRFIVRRAEAAAEAPLPNIGYTIASGCVALLVAYLSVTPVMNLLSDSQVMNGSFDPLDLVNTYGAFGTVGRERREIVFEGTQDDLITGTTQWKEYEFPFKPGNPMRMPPIITPYYGRLDWQIWFAAMASPQEYPWTLHFVWKLLHNDPGTLSLLANNPFPDAPPHYIRARLYTYKFAPLGDRAWWIRTPIGDWLPPLTTSDLSDTIQAQPWLGE